MSLAGFLLAVCVLLSVPQVQLAILDGPVRSWLIGSGPMVYASGYSHLRFLALRRGVTRTTVEAWLGPPITEVWRYLPINGSKVAGVVHFDDAGRVDAPNGKLHGASPEEVRAVLGEPTEITLIYSRPYSREGPDERVRVREVILRDGKVHGKRSFLYSD